MMRTRIVLTGAALACVGIWSAAAEDAGAGADSNGNAVVVTATRTLRERSEVPASVNVVSREAIDASPARNADDLLRQMPGTSVVRPVGIGHGMPAQILVRGVPGDHRVLLLADGLPLNESATGFQNLNEVPMQAVERVEAVSGPFSSLYGTDAFGGVVNLVLRDGARKPGTELSGAAGNNGFRDYNFLHAGRAGRVLYMIDAGRRSMDNYLARDYVLLETGYDETTGRYTFERAPAANLDCEDTRVLGKITADLDDRSHLTLQGRYFDSELGYGQTDVMPPFGAPENDRTDTRSAIGGAAFARELSPSAEINVGGWYRAQARDVEKLDAANGAGSLLENDSAEWQAESGINLEFGECQALAAGIEYRHSACDFSPVSDAGSGMPFPGAEGGSDSVWNWAGYVQHEIGPADKWRLVSGARVDYQSEFKEAVSPRAGLVCHVSDRTTVRTSLGRSFRAPTLTELFQPPMSFGPVTYAPNPDLAPEHITAADLEIEHRPVPELSLRVALFHNDMDDLIENSAKPGVENTWWNENIDEARSDGVEAGLRWQISKPVEFFAGGALQEAVDKQTGADLDYVPGSSGNIGLALNAGSGRWLFNGSVTEQYVGERGFTDWYGRWRDLDGYWRTDLALGATYRESIRAGVKVQNLTGEKYQESRMFALAPGRIASVEVGAMF